MAYGLIDYNTLKDIGNAIRNKTNYSGNYYPREMPNAINQIKSGEGFTDPVFYSLRQFYNNTQDNNIIYRGSLVKFEVTNQNPSNLTGYTSFGNVRWPGISPAEATFYSRTYVDQVNSYGGLAYGLYVDADKPEASILCMDGLFTYSQIREAVCGKYTTSMVDTYYGCSKITEAVCGNNVQLLDRAYSGCDNIHEAVVGDSVISMFSAYNSCYNLINGISGLNVLNMDNAYQGCSRLQSLEIGPKTNSIRDVANYCYNLTTVTGGNEVIYAANAFSSCYNLQFIDPMPNIRFADNMLLACSNLNMDSYNNFIFNANNLLTANNMFQRCNGLTYAYIPSSVSYVLSMYADCVNLTDAVIGDNCNPSIIFGIFMNCSNLVNVTGGESLTNIYSMFYRCTNLTHVANTPNVIDMSSAYAYTNVAEAYCGEYTTSMYETFANCQYITDAVCGNNVERFQNTYANCSNLVNAVCGDKVTTMSAAYTNCKNLTNYIIGPNVINLDYAYYNTNILGDVEIPDNVNSIGSSFRFCEGVGNALIKNTTLANKYWNIVNCFARNNYTVRRNIVLVYLSAYNNFVSFNGAGNFYKTNEVYQEPVGVNVNGITYNCVRCSYNTTYNCYIYCME